MAKSKKINEKLMALRECYRRTFTGKYGEQVLESLRKNCFAKHSTIPSDGNPIALAFNEGRRSVLLYIENTMNLDVESMNEAEEKEEADHV